MIVLRQLAKSDVELYRSVRLRGLEESPTSFGASYRQEALLPIEEIARRLEPTPDKWVVGAWSETELVGVIGFVRDAGDKLHHKGFIWGMYVVPEFRRQGIGRLLVMEMLQRIDALPGLRQVRLSVVTTNVAALRLYQQFGFVAYGEEPDALCVDGAFYAELHLHRCVNAALVGLESNPVR